MLDLSNYHHRRDPSSFLTAVSPTTVVWGYLPSAFFSRFQVLIEIIPLRRHNEGLMSKADHTQRRRDQGYSRKNCNYRIKEIRFDSGDAATKIEVDILEYVG